MVSFKQSLFDACRRDYLAPLEGILSHMEGIQLLLDSSTPPSKLSIDQSQSVRISLTTLTYEIRPSLPPPSPQYGCSSFRTKKTA